MSDTDVCEVCGGENNLHVCLPLVIEMLKKDEGFIKMIKQMAVDEDLVNR